MNTLHAALELQAAGISVVPVTTDGQKRPVGKWAEYQQVRASTTVIDGWFRDRDAGLGIVTGAVSGNLEMAEIEGRGADRLAELAEIATNSELGSLWQRLCIGWLESSPSGGLHWFYRVRWPEGAKPPGNVKLASRPSTTTELAANPRQKKQVIAETRGEGGYVIAWPSAGTVHPTGKPWLRIAGGPATVPVISPDEREAFHSLLGLLHEAAPEDPAQGELVPRVSPDSPDSQGLTPGDDFEAKTDWADILTPHGWTLVYGSGKTRYWRRPGKSIGISATTGHNDDRDRLYVFTSSTEFDQEVPYTKFGAYALLEHQGNHSDAASELRKKGLGAGPPSVEERTAEYQLTPFTPTLAAEQPAAPSGPITGQPEKRPENIPADIPATAGATALATVTALPVPAQTLTDHGNSLVLVNTHHEVIRYVPARKAWMVWDGSTWEFQDDDGRITEAMWECVQAIPDHGKEAVRLHKHKSLSRRSLEAAVALARRNSRVRIKADQLDAHPYELNAPNGIIDLRTGQLTPSDPAKFHTKKAGAKYNPAAKAPGWEAFLNTTFDGDQDMIRYIQRVAGYAATGEVTHHILPFLFGAGGNGKSQFLDVLVAILGQYATTAPAGFLMAGRQQHETEIARLAGMRLVVCSEVNKGATFDEAKVKLLTGGDRLTARFMNENHFSFIPTHTLLLMGNHQPTVGAGGDSFWRRLRLIPFTHSVPEEEKIVGLSQQLIADEAEGILAWLVQGAVDALRDGLQDPDQVLAATTAYAEEEDLLATFIEDRCTLGPETYLRTETSVLRREYASWCRQQGVPELSPQVFGRDLKLRANISQVRANGRRYYTGIAVHAKQPEGFEHWSDQ